GWLGIGARTVAEVIATDDVNIATHQRRTRTRPAAHVESAGAAAANAAVSAYQRASSSQVVVPQPVASRPIAAAATIEPECDASVAVMPVRTRTQRPNGAALESRNNPGFRDTGSRDTAGLD